MSDAAPPPVPHPTSDGDRVELRVHGVAGGQAEELLDVEPAMRVAGDGLAGFFRWRGRHDTETVPGVRREIFAWGNLTSGSSSRALWLLLLPFMLLNLAYWTRPGRVDRNPGGARQAANHVYDGSVRLLALSLTVLITLAAAGIGMDLIAWQCTAQAQTCLRARPWLGFLADPSSPLSAPGTALLLGALLPMAVVVVLWVLSRRTESEYEVVRGPIPPVTSDAAPLSRPEFWHNGEVLARLRSAHIAMALGTVALLLVLPALRYDLAVRAAADGPGPAAWLVGTVLAVLLGTVMTASTASVTVPEADTKWNARVDRVCRMLRDATIALGVGVAVYTAWPRSGWAASGPLPGDGATLNALFTAQGLLVLVLLAASVVLYVSDRAHDRTAMWGIAGPATAALGALLGGGFSAALVYQGSLWLSGCDPLAPNGSACLEVRPPAAYSWLQLAFALEAVIALAVVAVVALELRRATRAHLPEVTEQYARSVRDRRTWEIARARAIGRMTEILPAVMATFLAPVVPLVVLVLYSAFSGDVVAGPRSADTAVSGGIEGVARETVAVLVSMGAVLGGAALLGVAWIGRSAYRDRPTRQAVGALWDVGTFWPRVAHPLAPPSYAERAVPQLTARVARLARDGTDVVLSGHSQGSVLAAATVWQLPEDCVGRVALITHGSPLDRLYARYFPAYFGPYAFADLRRRVSGWRNLWRVTDAIADPVRTVERSADGPDVPGVIAPAEPLPDPRSYDPPPGEALRPEILGHSRYTDDPAYAESLWKVLNDVGDRHP
ncbi:hypothetical protein KIK06_19805 [Nocardiopsis sp. EMB25]|uniref:hypothetical protein n=1 Tax=Nocardiopsis sp. EMB25 TaxID=2835867 RepID=UPI0022838632|nr:hypothetical protein [Nocardiopsis sp. EMB25]MCY9786141.1 hypothetical protein [Nocardiopsis sp. EMB25]